MIRNLLILSLLAGALPGLTAAEAPARPYNVLFVIIDDHGSGLHDVLSGSSAVPTPNMRRLAARGTWFTHAYADSPACCPSRTAFLTGVRASHSGVYYNNQAYRRAGTWISKVQTLPAAFLSAGYLTAGYGKIAHNRFLEDDVGDYTPGYYKMFNRVNDVRYTQAALIKHIIPGSRVDLWSDGWSWGVLPDEWDREDPMKIQQDTEMANHAIDILKKKQDRQFYVTCGFWKPHVSWTTASRYYDRFPLESIQIPAGFKADDLEDLPKPARWLATHRGEHDYIVKNGLWKRCLQAYYASISYVDEQIGRVLDSLEQGPNNDNTIVVFAADNGWHTGEKNHWSKFYLSELACQVVCSIAVPGTKPQVVETPVSLLDIYPTLVSLCGLSAPPTHTLDGIDLTRILQGRTADRGAPVVSTYGPDCHSIRDNRFRYTRYKNGDEELYDHENDAYEWTNIAGNARFTAVKDRLKKWLPDVNAQPVKLAAGKDADDINSWEDEAFDPVTAIKKN